MKAADGFLSARQAAAYIGYEVGTGPSRNDPQMRCFYEFVTRHGVTKHRRGRCLLFRRVDLDRAINRSTDQQNTERQSRLDQMTALARKHAAGESTCVN